MRRQRHLHREFQPYTNIVRELVGVAHYMQKSLSMRHPILVRPCNPQKINSLNLIKIILPHTLKYASLASPTPAKDSFPPQRPRPRSPDPPFTRIKIGHKARKAGESVGRGPAGPPCQSKWHWALPACQPSSPRIPRPRCSAASGRGPCGSQVSRGCRRYEL